MLWQPTAGWMIYGHLRADSCTPGSAPGPTLGIQYGKALTFTFYCVSVCMSARSHISRRTCPNFTQFSANRPLTTTQYMLCTSGFVVDVMFSHNRAYVVHGEAYGRGLVISQQEATQRGELQHFRSAPLRCPPSSLK